MANNIIKGRKGGGSKQRTPTEQPDDLQSVAKAKILLALGEGEFAGGLTGKDIYLDGTPLENADGSQNFSGVSWEFRPGTQAQTYIQGIPGTENEISVGTEVTSKTAWTHTFTNTQLSAVRVRLKWPSLMKQEDDGDVVGNTVRYAIDLQTDGGAWQTVLETAVTGKTTSGYERSHRIDLPQAGSTWTLRLRKISPDANSVKVGDVMTLQSYTEVIDAKLRYPNTALLYIEFDSSQFNGSIPQIACEPRGRVIRVPDNYNPETREYTGVWTGGFKWAWTDNPAWIYYDIVIADRFGLGNRLSSANISKWTLYQIAQYCDQLVPDGRGGDGMEPRYTCNVYVQERNDAYTVLRDFAAIFRGMTCWNGEQIVVQADMPRDVDFTYTRANIVGKPRYSSSSSQVRYTNALVSWSDPDNAYADAMEPAFIPELVSRYSFNQLEMTAIGCTRQSEAHRKGLWGILTNNKDRMVEIDVGLDGRIPQPGYIIALADELLAGRVNGGRISAVNGRVITLDRDVDAKPGDRLQLNLPSGISQSRTIQAVNGRRQITVTTAYSETPERECVWAVESDDLFLQQYRVTGVKENGDATITITGVAHDPDKFARIDTGAIIDQRPVSVLPAGNQSPPEDIVITSRSVVNQGISVETMQVNWSAVSGAIAYEAQWRRNDGNWINVPRSSTTSFEVSGIYAGRYLVRVRAINAAEISSGWAYSEEKTMTGKVGEPLPPLALSTVSLTAGIEIRWEFPAGAEDTQRTELQYSPDQNGNGALPLTDLAYPGKKYQQMGLQIATQFWYRARLVDRLGNASSWTDWVHGMSSDNVSDYFQQLDEAIKDTETYQSLVKEIDTRAVAEEVDSAIEAAKKDVASQVTDAKQEAQQLVQDTRNDIEQALADEALARASAIAQESADRTAAIAREAAELSDAIAREAADRAYALADEARARATAISDAVKDEAAARSKAIADEAQKRNDALAAENAARVKAVSELDTRTADALANETAERIRAVSSEAKARADALLNEENNREAAISSLSSQLQTAAESLAQQISQVAAGTGEQFDPLNIWYFDTNNEGWTEDDNGYTPMIVTDDGWLKADNSTSSARSPNNLDINAAAYRFIKFRLKKVGNPAWKGRLLWIGADESGWDYARSVVIDEPEYDVNDTATVTLHDIPWLSSQRIRRFRLDLAQGQNEENYFLIDWLAVGRPTPGAGMAALQNEQLARTQADAAEAANRQDLAVQLRGSYDGNDLTKVSSGLIYQEQQARVTGDKAEASARQSLETRINNSLSTINQSLDTLNTADEAMASDITGLKSSLAGKADASALTTLKTQVTAQGDTLASQGASLTNLQNSLNRLSSDVSKKADATAVQSLQNQVTQQGKDITAANSSITNLKSSLETTNSNVSKKADATAVNDLTSRVTSAEGKVSSQGNSITRLNNSLNNVIADSDAAAAIPGNLIVNPSFERGTDGYIGVSAQSTVVAIQAPRTGTRALKVDPGSVAPGQTIDFVKDRTYEVGVWVKQIAGTTDNGAGNNKLRIGNSAGNPVLEVPYTGAGTDWTKYSKRWKATETARLPVTLNNYLTAGNRYFDDFYVIDVTDSVNIDANASAIASVQNMVTQQGKDITSQSSSITDLKNSLKTTDANVAKKADASAVQTLQNTVEQQGRDITTASSDISGLKNSLSTTDANVAKKADASALGALQSTVTQQGKDITSAGNSITQLQNSLASTNSAVNKKADAQALSALTGRVSDAEGKLSSQSDQLSTLENSLRLGSLISNGSLDNDATFWVNSGSGSAFVYEAAEKALRTTTGSIRIANTTRIPVEVGMTLTLSFEFKTTEAISAISSDSVGFITDLNDQTNWLVSQASWLTSVTTEWQRQTLTFTIPDKFTGQYVYLRFAAGGWSPSNSARLYLKNIEVYSSTGIAGKADASAVNDLSSRVEAAEGSITSQGNSLTNLRNSLNTTNANVSKKADASALQSLQNTVTQQGKTLSSASSDLSSLKNRLDITDGNVAKKADASALQNLQNTVSQQGNTLSSQASQLTRLNNSLTTTQSALDAVKADVDASVPGNLLVNSTFERGQDGWNGWTSQASVVELQKPRSGKMALRLAPASGTAALQQNISVLGGHTYELSAWTKVAAGTTMAPGSAANNKLRIGNLDGSAVADKQLDPATISTTTWQQTTLRYKPATDRTITVGLMYYLSAGIQYYDDVTFTDITDRIDIDANANATSNLDSRVTAAEGKVTSQGNSLVSLRNDLTAVQSDITNKADASAVSSLSGRVDTVEGKVTSQASDLTSLRNSLNTTNNNVSKKADTTALQSLQNKVEQQGNDISSAGSQITELNAAILAAKAAGDDYIPNPSLDPAYNRMGYTVQASDADGVPAGCPFAYVIRLASRDHIPGINNIAVTPGDVFEMSALVACGAGSADFNFYIGRATTVTGGIKARSSGGNTKATAAWTRVTWRFTVPSDTNLMRPFLQVNQSSPFGTIWYATDWHLRNVTAANKAQNTADNTASAVESLTTKVTQQGDMLSSIGSRTTTLENGLKTTNASVSKKADADTVQTLQNTVTQQGKDITAANSAITKLTGDLSTTNANVNRKADATALSSLQNTVTDQGQKLTSQGSSLTQLANTLSDAMTSLAADGKIPGNMISNGSFERGQDAFTGWNNVTSVIDAQSPNFGSRILMCAVGLAGITQKVPVVKGNTYKIGVFARAQGGSVMQDRNNNKLRIGGTSLLYDRQFDTANLPTDSSWVELTGTWKATVDGMVDVSIYSSLKSGAQYFDDFYLVDVTDEVNISANAGAISGLTTRVTNAEGKVTSQGNSITSLQNSLNTINSNVSKKADAEALQNLKNTVTQQGKDISTQSSNITSLQNSLNTANAGIDSLVADNDASKRFVGNLLANPSFERGLTGYSGGGAFITVIDAQSPNTGGRILSCGTGTGAVSQSVDVTKDRTYKIGVFTRCQAGSVLDAQGNNKLRIGSASLLYELQFRPTSSSWVELTGTWKATITGKVDVSINSSLKSGYQYFDDFYFIDITDRVDLDATSNAVSSLTSRVTNAEGTISSHTGSITSLNNSLSSLNKTVSGKADSSTVQALQNTVTQQGKDLAANASSLTSINASLSTLQSQGLNPWIDGSFESYAAGKSLYGDTAIVTTDVSRNGSKSLKITRKAGETGNSDKMLGKWLSVRGGGKYRFSFWAYMDSDMSAPNAWSAIVGLYARGENGGANQWPGAVTINETNITRGKWTFLTGVASVAADRSIAQMWISTRGPSGGAGFSLYLDDINIVDVTDAQAAQTDATAAANAVTQLTATVSQQGRDITAQAKQFTALQSSLNSTDARIARQDETIAANGLAMANGFNQMRSMIGDNSAAITTTNKTVTDLEKSTTESMTQLTSQVGDMSASVQQTASTVADLNGKLSAQWGVKVGTSSGGKHYVSGLQLGMDASGQSQFLVQADQFGVYVPNGDKSNLVFGVDGNGAYMQQAMARNLTINFGQITDSLQSTDYQPASTGWRLPKSGAFEMNGSVPGEGRVQLDSSGLAVYDQNGVLRCKIGRI
ncbi:carbohydrate binding domain-containing protein [Klebsiella pneumoniae]